jgi:hypothetical protein
LDLLPQIFVQPPAALESELETMLNMVLRLLPIAVRAPMAATETRAAIRPYSMAVFDGRIRWPLRRPHL